MPVHDMPHAHLGTGESETKNPANSPTNESQIETDSGDQVGAIDPYDSATDFPDPLVSGEPVEVSEGVFVIPDGRRPFVPNVGIVLGGHSALVIDTGIGPANGVAVLEHARRLCGHRRLYLALTQVDPGHGFGAQAFKGCATIIYSEAQQYRLRHLAASYVPTFESLGPTVARRLAGLKLVDCDVSYGQRMELDLGGTQALLQDWGPAHTVDDQTIRIDDRVLFGGDLFETRMFPILPYFPPFDTHFDARRWMDALDRLIANPPEVVVPGHGEVTTVELITAVQEHLRYMLDQVHHSWTAGTPVMEAAASITKDVCTIWSNWHGPRNIRHMVTALYDQFDRER